MHLYNAVAKRSYGLTCGILELSFCWGWTRCFSGDLMSKQRAFVIFTNPGLRHLLVMMQHFF